MAGEDKSGEKQVDSWKCEDMVIEAGKYFRNKFGYEDMYFNEKGFLLHAEFPMGIALVMKGLCGTRGEPRIIGELYGVLQVFESLGKDRLAEFLKLLAHVTGETFISAGLGPNDEIILEPYLPFSILYTPDAANLDMPFNEFVSGAFLTFIALATWVSVNIVRAMRDQPMVSFDPSKISDIAREELGGEIPLPGVLQL